MFAFKNVCILIYNVVNAFYYETLLLFLKIVSGFPQNLF